MPSAERQPAHIHPLKLVVNTFVYKQYKQIYNENIENG
jgi:hypothetical protein